MADSGNYITIDLCDYFDDIGHGNYVKANVLCSVSDGLRLISYQYFGTLPRNRSGSDPLYLDVANEDSVRPEHHSVRFHSPNNVKRLSRSHGNLLDVGEKFW